MLQQVHRGGEIDMDGTSRVLAKMQRLKPATENDMRGEERADEEQQQ